MWILQYGDPPRNHVKPQPRQEPMSEYQYYEFRAIERPLTNKQVGELRRYSSRADITATSFLLSTTGATLRGIRINGWKSISMHLFCNSQQQYGSPLLTGGL